MDLATARLIVAQGKTIPRDVWNRAQQTALWLLHQGEGRNMVLDNDPALREAVALYERSKTWQPPEVSAFMRQQMELVDIEPVEPGEPVVLDDDREDFIVDDVLIIESNTGRGGARRLSR